MNKSTIIYPFECKNCSKKVTKKSHHKNSHRKGRCRNKCDGIIRDSGGFPLDPLLRYRYKEALKLRQKANRVLKNLISEDMFYESDKWRTLRYQVLIKSDNRCKICKTSDRKLHVDHIKPRSKYPELELDITNLQVLCDQCNLGKGAN